MSLDTELCRLARRDGPVWVEQLASVTARFGRPVIGDPGIHAKGFVDDR